MIIQSVEKYSWRKTLSGNRSYKWSQVFHPQDSMPEHYIFFASFTSELILTHRRKMLLPWKCSHSQNNSRNSSNEGFQSLAWPPKWKQLWSDRTTFPWLAGVLLPHHVPSSATTLSQGPKAIGLHCQPATIPRLEGIPQVDFWYLIRLDCSKKQTCMWCYVLEWKLLWSQAQKEAKAQGLN